MKREAALAMDLSDPLGPMRNQFETADGLIYLDGNSLGRLPVRAAEAIAHTVGREWGVGLVRSWRADWVTLPVRVGDQLAPLIGAAKDEVLISDQTSVNLFKLASAALDFTGKTDIVSDSSNFPSDLYILEGVATARGGGLRLLESYEGHSSPDASFVAKSLDNSVGLVSLSHVDYRSSAVADMAGITAVMHEAGALALWDLSHSVGVYPVDLAGNKADLAVGCTYKYLNGGPGAPAFLYVKTSLQGELTQPIHGWFGHTNQFAFEQEYRPADGISRFSIGTPPILSLRGAQVGIELTAEVGVAAIRAKSVALTSLLIHLFDEVLADQGFELITPRDPLYRGGHVGIAHPAGWQMAQALIDREVIPDFREPDVVRLGLAPLYTRFVDVWDAVHTLGEIARSGVYTDYPQARHTVT